ncbi:galectin-3-binding protein [Trichechus manatus latirostris]|uniref:Galectin-3-binding protein n=1 Tax=Trichechus manatus latirostris TaxID=127582 RepID=A0A2Y9DH00_TRIMA|nr:galectin-3-binding protein [Trichechus manatus latirostris]
MAIPQLLWIWLLVAGTHGLEDGSMRLMDGNMANEGRVEIFYRGQWGTVCDDSWDLTDASVVCRALGFENATQALGSAAFGPGAGPIMLDDLECTGTEPSLADCRSRGWLNSNCQHEEDASVTCTSKTISYPAVHILDFSSELSTALSGVFDSQQSCDLSIQVWARGEEALSVCAHTLILSTNPEARDLLRESGSNVTMEVDAECVPVVRDFIRPLALLRTLLSRSELAVSSELALLKAVGAWGWENRASHEVIAGLLEEIRFPMMLPMDLFELQFNMSLFRDHEPLFRKKVLQALEFHTVPLRLLAQYRGLNFSEDTYRPRLYMAPTWSASVSGNIQNSWLAEKSRRSGFHSEYSYNTAYTQAPSDYRYHSYRSFQTPQHPSFLFHNMFLSWSLSYLPTVQSCWNYGFSCSSDEVPALGLTRSGYPDPAIGYENKALMLCSGSFVAAVTDFRGQKTPIPNTLSTNGSSNASLFSCPTGSFSSFYAVIRPFYLTNSSGVY